MCANDVRIPATLHGRGDSRNSHALVHAVLVLERRELYFIQVFSA